MLRYCIERPLLCLFFLQSLCIYLVFGDVLSLESRALLAWGDDGYKNYFTYLSYVEGLGEPATWAEIGSMNYPWGDSFFFADTTPLLSWPLRVLYDWGFLPCTWLFLLHDTFFLLGLLLTSLFCYKLLALFFPSSPALLFFALALSWTNPQIWRIEIHFNLSAAWLLLANAYYGLCYYRADFASVARRRALWFFGLFAFFAAAMHLYYIPILGFQLLALSLGFAWQRRRYILQFLRSSLPLYLSFALGVLPYFAILRSLDSNRALRPVGAMGYDWEPWKNSTQSLFRAYEWNSLSLPVAQEPKSPTTKMYYI